MKDLNSLRIQTPPLVQLKEPHFFHILLYCYKALHFFGETHITRIGEYSGPLRYFKKSPPPKKKILKNGIFIKT